MIAPNERDKPSHQKRLNGFEFTAYYYRKTLEALSDKCQKDTVYHILGHYVKKGDSVSLTSLRIDKAQRHQVETFPFLPKTLLAFKQQIACSK